MYHCNSCQANFDTPDRKDDTEGDESYDQCPKCGSDNFDELTTDNHD